LVLMVPMAYGSAGPVME